MIVSAGLDAEEAQRYKLSGSPDGRVPQAVELVYRHAAEAPGRAHQVILTEHVPSEMFANEHYATQLLERMGWALVDAEEQEQAIRA